MAGRVEHINQDRHGSGGGNRAERGVTPEDNYDEPEDDRSHHRLPANENEDAEASGDAFAAAKLQPDREHVADYGEDCAQHHPADVPAGPMAGDPDGEVAFCSVEEQGESARNWSGVASDVGGADVAAADAANISAAECLDDEQAERNGAEDVGDDGNQRRDVHKR